MFNPVFLCTKNIDICDSKYIEPIIKNRWILPIILKKDEIKGNLIINTVKILIERYKIHTKAYELGIKSFLFEFFYNLIAYDIIKFDINENHLEKNQIDKIKNALMFIHENYSEKTTINLLA